MRLLRQSANGLVASGRAAQPAQPRDAFPRSRTARPGRIGNSWTGTTPPSARTASCCPSTQRPLGLRRSVKLVRGSSPNPSDSERARPSRLPTIVVTLLFGIFGIFPAVTGMNAARAHGLDAIGPPFWWTVLAPFLFWILLVVLLVAALASASAFIAQPAPAHFAAVGAAFFGRPPAPRAWRRASYRRTTRLRYCISTERTALYGVDRCRDPKPPVLAIVVTHRADRLVQDSTNAARSAQVECLRRHLDEQTNQQN